MARATHIASWALAGLALLFAQQAVAQDPNLNEGIATTKHNFSVTSGRTGVDLLVTDYGEICVYCHTPHGGSEQAPLWNRAFSAETYQMYSEAPGKSKLDMTYSAQPTGTSLACLSCHDGTIGIDVIVNPPNGTTLPLDGTTMAELITAGKTDAFKNLGTDLRNDHPISMQYDPTKDAQFAAIVDITAPGKLKLFTDAGGTNMVQCATCHNPHTKNPVFLRLTAGNEGSALCLTCHKK